MLSSVLNNAQQLPQPMEADYEERVKVLKHLQDKLKREGLALFRQSERGCV